MHVTRLGMKHDLPQQGDMCQQAREGEEEEQEVEKVENEKKEEGRGIQKNPSLSLSPHDQH